jgi:hypothetical protein
VQIREIRVKDPFRVSPNILKPALASLAITLYDGVILPRSNPHLHVIGSHETSPEEISQQRGTGVTDLGMRARAVDDEVACGCLAAANHTRAPAPWGDVG